MPPITPNTNTTDPVDPTIESQVFWMKYKTPIIAGVLIVLIAAAAVGAYILYTNHRDGAAAAQLAQAKDAAGYEKVINDFGNTPAGASAMLMLAAEQRKAQKFAEANATLQKFLSTQPKHELASTAQMAMAGNLDSLGKTDEALELFKRIATEHPGDFNAPLAMLAQIPLLKAKGQVEQARQICENIITQYRDSEATNEAARYLRTLKPAATPAPAPQVAPAATAAPAASIAPGPSAAAPSAAPTP